MESTAFVLLKGVLQAAEVSDLLGWCQTGNPGKMLFISVLKKTQKKYDLHWVNGWKRVFQYSSI